ncbi:hypothetical protein LP419_40090 [Massilia sp. H-1]|nr:hypothetical protein LP419_40090 [Massilia sp. H-1]
MASSRVHAAQAPADQADRAPVLLAQLADFFNAGFQHAGPGPEIEALLPGMRVVAEVAQEAADDHRRDVARGQAGEHQDRVTVAARRALHEGIGGQGDAQFPGRAHLEREAYQARRGFRLVLLRNCVA